MYDSNHKSSLAYRLIWRLSLAIGVVSIIACTSFAVLTAKNERLELARQTDVAIAYLVGVLEKPLWDFDSERITLICETFSRNIDISSVICRDDSDETLYTFQREDGDGSTKRQAVVWHKGNKIGEVEVAFTNKPYHEHIRQIVQFSALAVALILLIVFFLMGYLVRRQLRAPLGQLSEVVEAYAAGDYSRKAPAASFTEFQRFDAVLLEMGERIHDQLRQVMAVNAMLAQKNEALVTATRELHESEERFRSLVESAPEAIFVQSQGRFVYANPAVLRLLGASEPEELIGMDFTERMAPEYLVAIRERIRYQRETGKPAPLMEQEYVRLDSSRVPVETTAVPIRYQGSDGHLVFARDITERKRAEAELRVANARLNAAVDLAGLGFYERVGEHQFVFRNERMRELIGVGPSHAGREYEFFIGRVHPDDRHKLLDLRQQLVEGRAERVFTEYRYLHPQRGSIWLSHLAVVQERTPDGTLARMIGVLQDITERKQAEDELRRSEERFAAVFNASPDSILMVRSQDGRIVLANPAACVLSGYSHDEVIGKTSLDLNTWVSLEQRQRFWSQVLEQGCVRDFEYQFRTKSGAERHGILSAVKTRIRGEDHVVSVHRDITEQKRAAEQIDLLLQTIDVHPDGAYWMDAESRFVYVNEAACRALGYSREELIGSPLALVNPRATLERMRQVWEVLRLNRSFRNESFHRRKDGTEFPVEIASTYVRIGDKEFICGFAHDITSRKRAEEALQAQRNTLNELFEHSPGVLLLVDGEFRVQRANRAIAELAKTPPQDMAALLCREVFRCLYATDGQCGRGAKCDDCPVRMRIARTLKKSERIVNEEGSLTVRTDEGHEERHFLISTVPVQVKEGQSVLVAINDITDRKRIEHAMQEYNVRLRSLAAQLALAEETERRKLAAILHDNIGQDLAVCNIRLGALESQIKETSDRNVVRDVGNVIRAMIERTRSLTFEISPRVLYDLGLKAALSGLCESTQRK
ncbi:MAG TPA: PAS domain S-box protein, partial [Planctomycetota bacterium]